MTNTGIRSVVPAIAVAALLFSACGSDDDGTTAAAHEPASTADETPESAATTETPATTPPTTTDAPAAAPVFTAQDAIDVVDAIGLAYDTYDVELFMAVTAADFQFVDERGTADQATQASYFPALREGGQKGEAIGDPVIVSEDPFVVAVDARITADWYPAEGRVGTSTYTLVVENGDLKVQEHRWTGDLL